VPNTNLAKAAVRRSAVKANIDTVNQGINHPSIFAWSVANELDNVVTSQQANFLNRAVNAVRKLDRTRFVAYDKSNHLGDPQGNRVFRRFTALGLNEYFGWYRASALPRPPSRTSDAGPYLDAMHRYYPRAALFITEFGAEANRNGPVTQKGTYQFQTRWTRDHLGIYASKPYINGAILWALKDFRVNPSWNGGNPKPNPPWNNKSLVEENGTFKPAWFEISKLFAATKPTR
jgi:beta-glucuronidase